MLQVDNWKEIQVRRSYIGQKLKFNKFTTTTTIQSEIKQFPVNQCT